VIKSSFEVGVAKQAGRSFDIIFIDPPYKKGLYEEVLVSLAKSEILTPETILILESGSGNKDYSIIDVYEVLKEKRYGNTLVRVLGYNLDFITFSPEKDELLSENSEYE
jgi:16S rRNA (guanine966-N2)-methyltransferase